MSHKRIYIRARDACTGCRICEMICSFRYEKDGTNPKRSRIRIRIRYYPGRGVITPMVCLLCKNPQCVPACPVNALLQEPETHLISVDDSRCDGCWLCVEACKFGGIYIHPVKNVAIVCDLCGGDPQCVRYCMNGTLVYCNSEKYRKIKGEKKSLKSFFSQDYAGIHEE